MPFGSARSYFVWFVLAGCLLLASGLFQTGAEAASTEDRLTQLEQQIVEIRLIRENLAEQTAAVSRLQEEVAQLRGALEEIRHLLQGSTLEALERRIARLESKLASAAPGAGLDQGGQPTPPQTSTPPAQPLTEDEAFAQAKGLFKKGDMVAARKAFSEFTKNFPASNKVPSAKFWIGETYYYQKRFEEAVLEYQKVIQEHPKSNKVASALLKQAFAFAEIKDTTSARLILQRLIKNHPKTQQAIIAKKKLATLKE